MMRAGRVRAVLSVLLVAGAFGVTGCGAEVTGAASAEAPVAKDAREGLRFAGTTLDGKPFKGSTLAGKPSVLWFWAPWCGVCRGQASQTAKLADKFQGKVNFVGVAGLDKTKPMRDFVDSRKVGGFPHLNDQQGSVWKKFGVTQQSSFVMLDKNGNKVHEGVPSSPGELDKLVSGLVR